MVLWYLEVIYFCTLLPPNSQIVLCFLEVIYFCRLLPPNSHLYLKLAAAGDYFDMPKASVVKDGTVRSLNSKFAVTTAD